MVTVTLSTLRKRITRPGQRTCQARIVGRPVNPRTGAGIYSARMGSTVAYFIAPHLEKGDRVEARWTKLSPLGSWTEWAEVVR